MAGGGRQYPLKTTRSPILILTLALLALLFLLYFIFSSDYSSSEAALPIHLPSQNPTNTDYSFVVSLERFLTTKPLALSPPKSDDAVADVNNLDDSVWITETRRLYDHPSPPPLPLRVYVYEMPSKFTYDLLWLFRNTYRDTSNLTSNGSPVHRLIEQVVILLLYHYFCNYQSHLLLLLFFFCF